MQLVICLVLVLFAVIALSYYENREYFVTVPTSNVNDIVMCASGDVANGKGAGSLYQIVTIPVTPTTPVTATPVTPVTATATTTLGTLNYCSSKTIASTWNPNYSWNPATATLATIDCTKYTLTSSVTAPPTTYVNPTLNNGDIVALLTDPSGIDTLYFYTTIPNKLRKVDSLATAHLMNTTADKPKILKTIPSGIIIDNNAITSMDLNRVFSRRKLLFNPTSQAAAPSRQDIVPQVSVSDTAYTAMDLQNKSALLQNIQKIVHNELTSSRNQPNNCPIAMGQESSNNSNSTCDQQGQEYNREKCDMSKYIKKDSIPCWGCTLDY
jgi:hypothetical protein